MRQRDNAVKALDEFCDSMTVTPVSYSDHVCDKDGGPSYRKVYMQTREVDFNLGDDVVHVRLQNDHTLRVHSGMRSIAVAPSANNAFTIMLGEK